jgi:hypothetical protein
MARGDALLRKVQRTGLVYLGLESAELRKSTSIVRPAIAICISYCATLSTCALTTVPGCSTTGRRAVCAVAGNHGKARGDKYRYG